MLFFVTCVAGIVIVRSTLVPRAPVPVPVSTYSEDELAFLQITLNITKRRPYPPPPRNTTHFPPVKQAAMLPRDHAALQEVVVTAHGRGVQKEHMNVVAVAWSLPVAIVGASIPVMLPTETGISHAFGSAFLWGVKGYLIALSANYLPDIMAGIAYLAWVWMFQLIWILGFHIIFSNTPPTSTYTEEWDRAKGLSSKLWISYLIAGVCACLGEASLQVSFGTSLDGSGPHYAISTAYCVILGPFFWLYANERMSGSQVFGLVIVIVGSCVMGCDDWASVSVSLVAMLVWAIDAVSYRLAGMWGSPPCVGVMLRLGVMSVCGVITLIVWYWFLNIPFMPAELVAMAFYNSLCDALSIWSLIRAFESKECKTGIVAGILPFQTVVMSLMNSFIVDWQPNRMEWIGLILVMLGCCTIAAFTRATTDEVDGQLAPKNEPENETLAAAHLIKSIAS